MDSDRTRLVIAPSTPPFPNTPTSSDVSRVSPTATRVRGGASTTRCGNATPPSAGSKSITIRPGTAAVTAVSRSAMVGESPPRSITIVSSPGAAGSVVTARPPRPESSKRSMRPELASPIATDWKLTRSPGTPKSVTTRGATSRCSRGMIKSTRSSTAVPILKRNVPPSSPTPLLPFASSASSFRSSEKISRAVLVASS